MGDIKTFEEMSLKEIEQLGRPEWIEKYKQELEIMKENKLSTEIIEKEYGKSIQDIESKILEKLYEDENKNRSEYFFPGKKVIVYSGTKYSHAQKELTCDFSGSHIRVGSLYICYRPLLKTIENGKAYVLSRTIKVGNGYEWYLPTTIEELEDLNEKINHYEAYDDNDIHYDHLYWSLGGELTFRELNRRKKSDNSISK